MACERVPQGGIAWLRPSGKDGFSRGKGRGAECLLGQFDPRAGQLQEDLPVLAFPATPMTPSLQAHSKEVVQQVGQAGRALEEDDHQAGHRELGEG